MKNTIIRIIFTILLLIVLSLNIFVGLLQLEQLRCNSSYSIVPMGNVSVMMNSCEANQNIKITKNPTRQLKQEKSMEI